MKNPLSHPRKRRNRNKNPRRTMRKLGSVEYLETRKLLTAAGFATELPPVENGAAAQVSTQHAEMDRVQRIVNGVETSDYSAVGIVNGQCTGTLIAPNAVLTAAHCTEGAVSGMNFEVGGKTYDVEQVHIHPDYQSQDIDLAVMILSENVTGVEPMDINRVTPQVGQALTLVGFGATGTPQSGHQGDFGVKNVGETPIDTVETNHILWDFDNASESNTAPGDSGGPAFITVNGQQVIAGVTSGGSQENAGLGDQSYDTRVDTFAAWIDSAVAGTADNGAGNTGGTTDPVDEGGNEGNGEGDPGGEFNASEAEELARDELAEFDTNGDGSLSQAELTAELASYGYTNGEAREEVEFLLSEFDADRDGLLNLGELTESWGGESMTVVPDDVEEPVDEIQDPVDNPSAEEDPGDGLDGEETGGEYGNDQSATELAEEELTTFDANNDGELSAQELGVALESYGYDADEAADESQYLVEDFDADGNGQLSFDELIESYGGEPVGEEGVGDADLDGDVDSTDLGFLLNNYGDSTGLSFSFGNMNDDEFINSMDLGLMLNNFGFGIDEIDTFDARSVMPVEVGSIGGSQETDEEGGPVDLVFAEYSTCSVL